MKIEDYDIMKSTYTLKFTKYGVSNSYHLRVIQEILNYILKLASNYK